jgi:hypothetical protein
VIISHRHRFIFLKTRKTAGTSVEIALSRICGDDDVITAISPEDEPARREFAGRGAQNENVPWRHAGAVLRTTNWKRPRRPAYYNHMPAALAQSSMDESVWHEYFTFSIERNPFDRLISMYWWQTRKHESDRTRPTFDTWLARARYTTNWPIYAIDGTVAADFVIRYESLSEGLAQVSSRIGEEITMPEYRAKARYRTDRRPPEEFLTTEAIARISDLCRDEIRHFGYTPPLRSQP